MNSTKPPINPNPTVNNATLPEPDQPLAHSSETDHDGLGNSAGLPVLALNGSAGTTAAFANQPLRVPRSDRTHKTLT
jgi:hypothetical protein